MELKRVTYKNLKLGQEINGTYKEGLYRGFRAFVKDINLAYVTVEMWEKGGKEEKISTDHLFRVEMSEKEFEQKYRNGAKEVLQGIQNKLHGDEIGYHEMWNSWLFGTPYEIAKYCVGNKMKIVGYSTDIVPKQTFQEDIMDAGVCAEYEDGERIWCHFWSSRIKEMVNRYKDLLN